MLKKTLFILALTFSNLILASDYNVCCDPRVQEGVFVDFLWWKAEAEGLELGKEIFIERDGLNSTTGNYANVFEDSKERSLKFDYDPGFRVGIWFSFPRKNWDVMCDWTQFHTTASACGFSRLDPNVPPGNSYLAFFPYWETLAQNFPDNTHAKWKLDINLVDISFGRDYGVSTCFFLRPYFGLRFAQVNQQYKVCSEAHQSGDFNSASYIYSSRAKAKSDFAGIGPRLGCDAELELCWGFSLFGKAAGSLIYGRFDSHSHECFDNDDFFFYLFENFDEQAHHSNNDWRSRAITDLAIGLKYEHCFCWGCKQYPISLSASWEHHAFWDFEDFNFDSGIFNNKTKKVFNFGPYVNIFPSFEKRGNLFTQGLTVSLAVGF